MNDVGGSADGGGKAYDLCGNWLNMIIRVIVMDIVNALTQYLRVGKLFSPTFKPHTCNLIPFEPGINTVNNLFKVLLSL